MAKAKAQSPPPSQSATVYVNTGTTDLNESQAPGKVFVPKEITRYQLKGLKSILKDSLRQCTTSLDRALIIAICADSSESWLLDALNVCMDGLPLRLFNYVNLQGQGQSAAAMPHYDNDETTFTFLLNYPSTSPTQANIRTPVLDFEDQSIKFQGVAALILSSSRLDESRDTSEPLIILYMTNSAMLPLFERHWGGIENSWRMNRLLQCPLWLYIDLLQACGHWSKVWGVAGNDLAWRNTQAYRETSRSSTLRLTRRLHKATSNVITLRENLRLHIASTEKFQDYVLEIRDQSFSMPDDYAVTLNERTRELLQDLRHHWATSEVILEQYKSLMSLVFNTETVTQGQAVARLNLLAFAFLPLSFVTGIFGMTTWTISAVWYPVWAFAALVLLTIAAYVVSKVSIEDRGESTSWLSHLHWGVSRKPKADVESPSIQRALASAAIAPTAIVTAKMSPLTPKESFLGRTGSYGRNRRGPRRARRQAERHTSGTNGHPGLHHPTRPNVSRLSIDPDDTPAALPSSSDEAEIVSDTYSAVPMERDHGDAGVFHDNDYIRPQFQKHVAFQGEVTTTPFGTIQERQDVDLKLKAAEEYNARPKIAREYDTQVAPPEQRRKRERDRSHHNQGTYQQGLNISVYETQAQRPAVPEPADPPDRRRFARLLQDIPSLERQLANGLNDGLIQDGGRLTGEVYRGEVIPDVIPEELPRKRVKSKSTGRTTYQMGLSLIEKPQTNTDLG